MAAPQHRLADPTVSVSLGGGDEPQLQQKRVSFPVTYVSSASHPFLFDPGAMVHFYAAEITIGKGSTPSPHHRLQLLGGGATASATTSSTPWRPPAAVGEAAAAAHPFPNAAATVAGGRSGAAGSDSPHSLSSAAPQLSTSAGPQGCYHRILAFLETPSLSASSSGRSAGGHRQRRSLQNDGQPRQTGTGEGLDERSASALPSAALLARQAVARIATAARLSTLLLSPADAVSLLRPVDGHSNSSDKGRTVSSSSSFGEWQIQELLPMLPLLLTARGPSHLLTYVTVPFSLYDEVSRHHRHHAEPQGGSAAAAVAEGGGYVFDWPRHLAEIEDASTTMVGLTKIGGGGATTSLQPRKLFALPVSLLPAGIIREEATAAVQSRHFLLFLLSEQAKLRATASSVQFQQQASGAAGSPSNRAHHQLVSQQVLGDGPNSTVDGLRSALASTVRGGSPLAPQVSFQSSVLLLCRITKFWWQLCDAAAAKSAGQPQWWMSVAAGGGRKDAGGGRMGADGTSSRHSGTVLNVTAYGNHGSRGAALTYHGAAGNDDDGTAGGGGDAHASQAHMILEALFGHLLRVPDGGSRTGGPAAAGSRKDDDHGSAAGGSGNAQVAALLDLMASVGATHPEGLLMQRFLHFKAFAEHRQVFVTVELTAAAAAYQDFHSARAITSLQATFKERVYQTIGLITDLVGAAMDYHEDWEAIPRPPFGEHFRRTHFSMDPRVTVLDCVRYPVTPNVVRKARRAWELCIHSDPVLWRIKAYRARLFQTASRLASRLNCSVGDVQLHATLQQALATVLKHLPWIPGVDTILLVETEAVAGSICSQLASRRGITVHRAHFRYPITPLEMIEAFRSCLDRYNPKVVIMSLVTTSGDILPLSKFVQEAQHHGSLIVLEGSEALGQISLNVGQCGADYFVAKADGYMYCPPGVSVLVAAPQRQRSLSTLTVSYYYGQGYGEEWTYTGLVDQSTWVCIMQSLEFFKIITNGATDYLHDLARRGHDFLCETWKVPPLRQSNASSAVFAVLLPLKGATSAVDALHVTALLAQQGIAVSVTPVEWIFTPPPPSLRGGALGGGGYANAAIVGGTAAAAGGLPSTTHALSTSASARRGGSGGGGPQHRQGLAVRCALQVYNTMVDVKKLAVAVLRMAI